jgi:uncharacterized protein YrrD
MFYKSFPHYILAAKLYTINMLMLSQRLLSLPIVSIQTGGQLGKIAEAIIDPRHLKIVAFYCNGPAIQTDPAVLHAEDVREISPMGLIIDSADNIMSTDDLVRLKEVLDFNFKLDDKLVVQENGHKIGKVSGYSLEASSFYIIKLHVKPGILGSFSTAERIIDRSQIAEITPQKIVVKDPTTKDEKPVREEVPNLPMVENPFRKRSPQTDSAKLDS